MGGKPDSNCVFENWPVHFLEYHWNVPCFGCLEVRLFFTCIKAFPLKENPLMLFYIIIELIAQCIRSLCLLTTYVHSVANTKHTCVFTRATFFEPFNLNVRNRYLHVHVTHWSKRYWIWISFRFLPNVLFDQTVNC